MITFNLFKLKDVSLFDLQNPILTVVHLESMHT